MRRRLLFDLLGLYILFSLFNSTQIILVLGITLFFSRLFILIFLFYATKSTCIFFTEHTLTLFLSFQIFIVIVFLCLKSFLKLSVSSVKRTTCVLPILLFNFIELLIIFLFCNSSLQFLIS